VPPGDARAMADAIELIISTPGLADEMSSAAWEKAESFDSLCIRREIVNALRA
jgi:glycosyltransferase involved in cell wall biosynthesis